jgi:hypothetical protein
MVPAPRGAEEKAAAGVLVAKRKSEAPGEGIRRAAPAIIAGTFMGIAVCEDMTTLLGVGIPNGDVTTLGPEYTTFCPVKIDAESSGIPHAEAESAIEGASPVATAVAASAEGDVEGDVSTAGCSAASVACALGGRACSWLVAGASSCSVGVEALSDAAWPWSAACAAVMPLRYIGWSWGLATTIWGGATIV